MRGQSFDVNGPRWTAFAAVNVRVSPVAKADVRGRDVVVVVCVGYREATRGEDNVDVF